MNDLLNVLSSRPGEYVGRGTNHEQERFVGRLRIESLVGGKAVMLHYLATRDDGMQVHTEATLLSRAADGRLCVWPVMEELPVVLAHTAIDGSGAVPGLVVTATFASGPREAIAEFREELTISLQADGALVYAHAWGLPGGEFAERSRCELQRGER